MYLGTVNSILIVNVLFHIFDLIVEQNFFTI